jgi:serine protease DegQ
MQQESSFSNMWRALSNDSAGAIEKAGAAIVAVQAGRRIPASGIHWRPGIIVTADHALERDDEIMVTLPGGSTVTTSLAGRDPSTDLAVLRVEGHGLPLPEIGDTATLKVGHWVLAAGRTAEGGPRASLALVGVVGPAWRSWRGGLLDFTVRLDRNLHPNFSGGAIVNDQGQLLGISTSALSRYAAVVIPVSTIQRVVGELEKNGYIGRGYFGISMQPVRLPRKLRESLKLAGEIGIMVAGVESESPAEKAGVMLGDVLVALDANPVRDIDDLQGYLTLDYIGKPVKVSILRGGVLTDIVIAVGKRPAVD